MLGEDLLRFELEDIASGLDDIARYPRREGETAFPEMARLKQAVAERKAVRESAENRRRDAEMEKYRKDHPEEFISWRDFWIDPAAQDLARKIAIVPGQVDDENLRKRTIEAARSNL